MAMPGNTTRTAITMRGSNLDKADGLSGRPALTATERAVTWAVRSSTTSSLSMAHFRSFGRDIQRKAWGKRRRLQLDSPP